MAPVVAPPATAHVIESGQKPEAADAGELPSSPSASSSPAPPAAIRVEPPAPLPGKVKSESVAPVVTQPVTRDVVESRQKPRKAANAGELPNPSRSLLLRRQPSKPSLRCPRHPNRLWIRARWLRRHTSRKSKLCSKCSFAWSIQRNKLTRRILREGRTDCLLVCDCLSKERSAFRRRIWNCSGRTLCSPAIASNSFSGPPQALTAQYPNRK
jgi:hypothetical protein